MDNKSNHTSNAGPPPFTNDQYKQLLRLLQDVNILKANLSGNFLGLSSSSFNSDTWVINTGAANHITFEPHHLTNPTHYPSPHPTIGISNGVGVSVTSHDSAPLTPIISLDNVLCTPSFKYNLLSISKLTQTLNCSITFFPNHCLFQNLLTKKIVGRGHECGGLYYL